MLSALAHAHVGGPKLFPDTTRSLQLIRSLHVKRKTRVLSEFWPAAGGHSDDFIIWDLNAQNSC